MAYSPSSDLPILPRPKSVNLNEQLLADAPEEEAHEGCYNIHPGLKPVNIFTDVLYEEEVRLLAHYQAFEYIELMVRGWSHRMANLLSLLFMTESFLMSLFWICSVRCAG